MTNMNNRKRSMHKLDHLKRKTIAKRAISYSEENKTIIKEMYVRVNSR